MSDNGGDNQLNKKSPQKPPRPPAPSTLSKLPRSGSIQKHMEALQGLKPERIRWFVKEDKKWLPLNGSDSLAVEKCFREMLELESKAEDEPKVVNSSSPCKMPTIKGGLYEVDVVARKCKPIYWKGNSISVCRGTWFTGTSTDAWQPLCEEDANQIEESHQTMWRAMGIPVGPVETGSERQGIGRLTLKGFYVEWNDIADVWLYWDDVKSRIIRNVSERIGLSSGPASQLHRGFHTDAEPDDRPPDISHLVFVVHGIGQLLHMSNIVKSCTDLRQGAATVLNKQQDISQDQRIEFVPVEWRSSLKLDEGTIDRVTPSSMSGLRKLLNTSMMDVMYYTSPYYRNEIIDGVRDEMNRLYAMFCARNPDFSERNGKVSIVAHSLGSVIAYDILTLWDTELRHLSHDSTTGTGFLTESVAFMRCVTEQSPLVDESDVAVETDTAQKQKENLRIELAKSRSRVMQLEAMLSRAEVQEHGTDSANDDCPYALRFKVTNLFCVGSPLAAFLALRGIRPQDDVEDNVLPKSVCKRVMNIYHPADPVAYRLEPLLSEDYVAIPPAQLPRYDSKQGTDGRPSKTRASCKWGGLFTSYRMGFHRHKPEAEEAGSNSEENEYEDEVVIVHNATAEDKTVASCTDVQSATMHMLTDGASVTSPKRTGWLASLFGSASKPMSSSTSSQESEETLETDGAKKDEPAKNAEHITVPAKVLKERLDFTLREGYMEYNYWSAVTSHVTYWNSCDVARFILEHCLDTGEGEGASEDPLLE